VYGLSIGDKFGDLGSTLTYCSWEQIFPQWISRTLFVGARRNLAVLRIWPIDTYSLNFVNIGLLFQGEANIFDSGYMAHYLSQRDEIWQRWGSGQSKLIPEFRELLSWGPVIPCGGMHQSFTGILVKWFIENFPMFADSFSVLSIHCVPRGLGASFLYKCLHRAVVPCDSTAFLLFLVPSLLFVMESNGFMRVR